MQANRTVILIISLATLLAAAPAGSTPPDLPTPPGLAAAGSAVEPLVLAPVDPPAVVERRPDRPRPLQVASRISVAADTAGDEGWTTLPDGSLLWTVRITSPGAVHLSLAFDQLRLPPEGRLWVHDPDGAVVHGPYGSGDRNGEGGLFTPYVPGDEIVVAVQVPADGRASTSVRLAAAHHGIRRLTGPQAKQQYCNVDSVCPEGDPYRDQIRSVARITIAGIYGCTGQLVNNTAEDGRPLLLTAQHCIENSSDAASVVVYWNFESASCGDLSQTPPQRSQSGSTLLASSSWAAGLDFALVELDEVPAPEFDVYYSGWDASGTIPSGVIGIHHPQADAKALAIDFEPGTITRQGFDFSDPDGGYYRIGGWDVGLTEQGSSGSCIYDLDAARCVGVLSTGDIFTCPNIVGNDWYGWLTAMWDGDGSPASRLRDWLDPVGGGSTRILDGIDAADIGAGQESLSLLVAAASTPGVGDSNWKSQIVVANTSDENRSVIVRYIAAGDPWPGQVLLGPLPILPRQTRFLDDPLLPFNPTAGAVAVVADGDGVLVSSRTFNLAASGVTFGQGIPGVRVDDATTPTEVVIPLVLSVPARYRANLGLVQTSAGSYAVEVELFSPGGTVIATRTYTSDDAFRQINDVIGDMNVAGAIEGGWMRLRVVSGSPTYWTAYLSIIDEDSNDPTFVAGVPQP